jgi:competence protein ComEC
LIFVASTIDGVNCVPSLLAGILLGVESGIPDEVDQAFRDTGTSHIIAISGFNITIIGSVMDARGHGWAH